MQIWAVLITFSSVCLTNWLQNVLFVDAYGTIKFSLANRKNQTGHLVSHMKMDKSSMDLPDNWNMEIEKQFLENNGRKTVRLFAVITVPPPIPTDYELFPGIGYYKFHPESAPNFDEASAACSKEGGHLAILNSPSESAVLETLWKRHPKTENFKFVWAYIGFHDRLKEGQFVTIFGQPLNSTGFTKWAGSNPDDYNSNEDCGSVTRDGQLNDMFCGAGLPFVCEYDLSWN